MCPSELGPSLLSHGGACVSRASTSLSDAWQWGCSALCSDSSCDSWHLLSCLHFSLCSPVSISSFSLPCCSISEFCFSIPFFHLRVTDWETRVQGTQSRFPALMGSELRLWGPSPPGVLRLFPRNRRASLPHWRHTVHMDHPCLWKGRETGLHPLGTPLAPTAGVQDPACSLRLPGGDL